METAFRTAANIADRLCDLAHSYRGKCSWFGPVLSDEDPPDPPLWVNLGPELYDGSSGIALFLGEMFARTGDVGLRAIAEGGIAHALGKAKAIPSRERFGTYCGTLGVAYAAARLASLLDRPRLERRALELVSHVVQDLESPFELDFIGGAAGAVPVLLTLSDRLRVPELAAAGVCLGRAVLGRAVKEEVGWSWPTKSFRRNLTGLSHGASGFGYAFLKLYARTGEQPFMDAALEAFRYEDHWLQPAHDNWPDFRWEDESGEARFAIAWCQGAPGIGLSRLAGLDVRPEESFLKDVEVAVRASKRYLADPDASPDGDFCLCHGRAGVASFLLLAGERVNDPEAREIALATASSAAKRYEAMPDEWPTGRHRCQAPGLMSGLAGIGYFYLGLADSRLPSLLLLSG